MAEDIIRARIVFDTGGLSGVVGKGGGGGSGVGGLAGAFGKAGAIAGVVAAGVTAIISVLKRGFEMLKQASPKLQQSISIMSKALQLSLRPIGDVLGLFLRPFAIAWLRWALKFYQAFKKVESPVEKVSGIAKVGTSALTMDLPKLVEGLEQLGLELPSISDVFSSLSTNWASFWDVISLKINEFIEDSPFLSFIADIGASIKGLISGDSWGEFLDNLILAWDEFKTEVYTEWVTSWNRLYSEGRAIWQATKDYIVGKWEGIKTFIMESDVAKWILGAFDSVKTFFTVTLPGWITSGLSFISGGGSSGSGKSPGFRIASTVARGIRGFFGGSNKVTDAIITKTGQVIRTDPNDTLFATKNPSSIGGGSRTINVTVNALDAGSISQSVLNKITRAVEDGLKSGMSVRTTESRGMF